MKERIIDFLTRLIPVVTGIAITFTVQAMINRAHARREVRSALQLVRTELVSNQEDIAILNEYLEQEVASAQYLEENADLVKNLSRLDSLTAQTVKYHLGMVGADVTLVFPHDALELLKMSSLFPKIGDNNLSMKIIRAYDSCAQMSASIDRHLSLRDAQAPDEQCSWVLRHDPRDFADVTDIEQAITAIDVFLRKH